MSYSLLSINIDIISFIQCSDLNQITALRSLRTKHDSSGHICLMTHPFISRAYLVALEARRNLNQMTWWGGKVEITTLFHIYFTSLSGVPDRPPPQISR